MSPPPAKHSRLTTTTDEGTGRAEPREGSRAISTLRPDTVFRLRRIPETYGKKDIPALLRAAFQQNSDFPVEVGSLARSPYRANEKVATVTLSEARNLLLDIPTVGGNGFEWQLEVNLREQERFTLHLDTQFQGLTPLHECDEGAYTADIIAVSGLNGHAFGSFKQRGGPFMWLRDGLPKDLPNTRIFIYGYDTQLQGSSSVQNLTDLGMGLRAALTDLLSRDGKHHSRSLLFIGHSLGGLVIKEAVIHMKGSPFARILTFMHGFMFFGVPNLGMATGSLIPMVGDQPNRGLLETLGRNSALLRRHQNEFRKRFGPKRIQITSFYETRLSRTACKVGAEWKMQGPEELLVDFASATIGSNNYHPIDRDHSEMVKFSSVEDSNYRTTLIYIRQLSSHTSFQEYNMDLSTFIDKLDIDESEKKTKKENAKKCLRSLAFRNQDWHCDGITSADMTCDWIFTHKIFHNWSQNPRQLLWIHGKPGSGKSTMMKHIFQSISDQKTERQILATFFFNGGDRFLTSLLAVYRALLNQILPHFPEQLLELTKSYERKDEARGKDWDWSVDELHRFFAEIIPVVSAKHHLCILVDALDEAGEKNAYSLILQFEKILASAQHAGGVLKICFSCRHYPILTLDSGLTITMEDYNHGDIETVIREQLQQLNKEKRRTIEDAIICKAQGVFQWACLVTNKVYSLSKQRKSIEYILETIKKTPKELERLYSNLLLASEPDEDPSERKQILKLFRWMCFATRPLTLAETRHCLAIDAEMSFKSVREYVNSENFTRNKNDIVEVVKHISRGLAEFRYNGSEDVLQPIHQTVLDYLLEYGLNELRESAHGDLFQSGHYYIFKSCVKYLKLEGIIDISGFRCYKHRNSFLEYSLVSLPYHLHQTTRHEIVSGDLLDTFDWPRENLLFSRWATIWRSISPGRRASWWEYLSISPVKALRQAENHSFAPIEWPQYGLSLLHLAALVGKPEILDLVLGRASIPYLQCNFQRDYRHNCLRQTPLDVALWTRQESFALDLIFKIPHVIDTDFVTDPWPAAYLAAAGEMNKVLSIALERGMNPNGFSSSEGRYTLLSEAVLNGRMSTCSLLLDYGADPNLFDHRRHNSLSLAIACGNKSLCRLLISRGADIMRAVTVLVAVGAVNELGALEAGPKWNHLAPILLRLTEEFLSSTGKPKFSVLYVMKRYMDFSWDPRI